MKKRPFQNASINQITLIAMLFSAAVIVVFAALIIADQYRNFRNEMDLLRENYLKSQKELLVAETSRAMRYIRHKYAKHGTTRSEAELKEIIVDAIEHMRDERDGTGYVFIYTYEGVNIADPILKHNAGQNLIDFTDPSGKRVIAELIDVARQGGGFVEYVWNKPIVNVLSPKLSYATGFEPFKWMVGTGVYMDTIEEEIDRREAQHRKDVVTFVFRVLFVGVALFVIVALFSRWISRLIKRETDEFLHFFHEGATTYRAIDKSRLRFREFLTLVDDANAMIGTIAEKTESLRELNATLEDRVRQKTAKLTAQKERIEKLLEEQDRFVKNAIHEINTPLSVILVNSDLEVMQKGRNRHLTNIESGAKIIHNIYNDLSYLIQKDRIEYPLERINLGDFVRLRADFFAEVAAGAGLKLEVEAESDLWAQISATELQRVVDNTLSNAVKYSYPDTAVRVGLESRAGRPVLWVENSGNAIADRARLFERYYREDTVRGGFGLGLSIIKEICDKYAIDVELTCENGRNRFAYTFAMEEE